MLGGGVMVQRLGDLLDGRRSNEHRLARSFVRPTLNATPGISAWFAEATFGQYY